MLVVFGTVEITTTQAGLEACAVTLAARKYSVSRAEPGIPRRGHVAIVPINWLRLPIFPRTHWSHSKISIPSSMLRTHSTRSYLKCCTHGAFPALIRDYLAHAGVPWSMLRDYSAARIKSWDRILLTRSTFSPICSFGPQRRLLCLGTMVLAVSWSVARANSGIAFPWPAAPFPCVFIHLLSPQRYLLCSETIVLTVNWSAARANSGIAFLAAPFPACSGVYLARSTNSLCHSAQWWFSL